MNRGFCKSHEMTLTVNEKLRRALHGLGLTDYEIKAYTVLIEEGKMTANKLSGIAGIPYSKIYEVLESLEEKGWIGVEGGRPAHYFPKSPVTALEISRMKKEKEFKTYEEIILSELLPVYEGKGVKEKHDIWILRGEENILMKIRDVISNCEEELLAAAPWLNENLLNSLFPLITIISNKGGKAKIMISSDCDYGLVKKLSKVAEVRVKEQMFGGGVIADSKEVVLILGEEKESISLAIWSEHIGLAKFAKSYFEYLWKEAEPVKTS